MTLIRPDMSQVEELGNINPGSYDASVTAVTASKSQKSGHGMLEVKLDVTVEGKTRKRTTYVMYEGKGAYRYPSFLKACGFADVAERVKKREAVEFDTDKLVGARVRVTIDTELQDGEERDRIANVLPAA